MKGVIRAKMDLNRVLIEASLPKEVRVFNIRYTPRMEVSEKLARSLEKNEELILAKLVRKGIIIPSTFGVDRYFSGGDVFNVASFDIFRTKLIFLGLTRPFFISVRAVDKIKNALSIPVSELASFKNPGKFKSTEAYNISLRFFNFYIQIFLDLHNSKVSYKVAKNYLDTALIFQRNVKVLPKKLASVIKKYASLSRDFKSHLEKHFSNCIENQKVPSGGAEQAYIDAFGIDPFETKLENIFFPFILDVVFPGRPAGRVIAEFGKWTLLNQLAKICL